MTSVTERLRSAPCGFRDNFGVKEVLINQERWEAEVQGIAGLEAENAALREFVVADDAYQWALEAALTLEDFDRCTELLNQKEAARRRLADEFGLPLPEVER